MLSRKLSAFALISLGLACWSVSRFEVIKFSTEVLVQSANRLIDRSQMTQEHSQSLDRTFEEIVNNDRAWQRQIAATLPVAVLGFAFLAALFAYAAWGANQLERQIAAAPALAQ